MDSRLVTFVHMSRRVLSHVPVVLRSPYQVVSCQCVWVNLSRFWQTSWHQSAPVSQFPVTKLSSLLTVLGVTTLPPGSQRDTTLLNYKTSLTHSLTYSLLTSHYWVKTEGRN